MTTRVKLTMADGVVIELESDVDTSDNLMQALFRQVQRLQEEQIANRNY